MPEIEMRLCLHQVKLIKVGYVLLFIVTAICASEKSFIYQLKHNRVALKEY
jgi:hypothetical protein